MNVQIGKIVERKYAHTGIVPVSNEEDRRRAGTISKRDAAAHARTYMAKKCNFCNFGKKVEKAMTLKYK